MAPVDPEMAQIWSDKLGFTILSADEVIVFSIAYSSSSWNDNFVQFFFELILSKCSLLEKELITVTFE
jgi:hypothetical protein